MKKSKFQLIGNPTIIKNIFILNEKYEFDGKIALEIDNEINIEHAICEGRICMVKLNLNIFKNKDLIDIPFTQELEVVGKFSWDDELDSDKDLLEVMLKSNAPAILYSYLRPLITASSINANLPPLVIPLMNFSE